MKFVSLLLLLVSISSYSADLTSCFGIFQSHAQRLNSFPYSFKKPLHYQSNSTKRSIEEIYDLNFATFNLQKFAKKSKYLSSKQVREKSQKIMSAIQTKNLDIVVFQEVLEVEYLEKMVKRHLNDNYKVLSIKGDSISDNIVFIIKKDLPFRFSLHSMEGFKTTSKKLFRKDFPILEMTSETNKKVFFGGVHLKSKYGGSVENNFYESIRTKQANGILNIKEKISNTYGSDTPFIIAGDFNSSLNRKTKEFENLQKYMNDSFDQMAKTQAQRTTNIAFDQNGKRHISQLDGILYNNSSSRVKVKNVYVHQFKARNGVTLNMNDPSLNRNLLPSDHGLLITTFDMKALID